MTTNPNEAKIRELENEQNDLSDRTDPADFFTIINILAENEETVNDFLESHLYKDLLHATQSNPERTHEAIRRMIQIDDEIEELDN